MWRLEIHELDKLFGSLKQDGYQLIGPKVQDRAIIYDEIYSTKDLPQGWTHEQEAGTYRLTSRSDQAYFGFTVGPHSWKKYLLPPKQRLWKASQQEGRFTIEQEPIRAPKMAFIGVRSCELSAIAIQDRVLYSGDFVDPVYKARRDNILLIVVQCGKADSTCFCTSMNTGPKAEDGFDLALTEIIEDSEHYFVVESSSERGTKLLEQIQAEKAPQKSVDAAQQVSENTAKQIQKRMDTDGLKELLYAQAEHPQWQDVADRCLSCANCTMVCPTCFCTDVNDVTDLTGENAERWRTWDSCFHVDYSYIHGGPIRPSVRARYRQWMTHKLASWHDQFDTSGCVGCGRCITWCPSKIDITAEVAAIRSSTVEQTEE